MLACNSVHSLSSIEILILAATQRTASISVIAATRPRGSSLSTLTIGGSASAPSRFALAAPSSASFRPLVRRSSKYSTEKRATKRVRMVSAGRTLVRSIRMSPSTESMKAAAVSLGVFGRFLTIERIKELASESLKHDNRLWAEVGV